MGGLRSNAGHQRTATKRQTFHISIWLLAIVDAKNKEYGHRLRSITESAACHFFGSFPKQDAVADIIAYHDRPRLADHDWQSLYHFTTGGPVHDLRLRTAPPYAHLVNDRRLGQPLLSPRNKNLASALPTVQLLDVNKGPRILVLGLAG